jgi:hypothetical protein
MTMIDSQGRLLGRINLVDAAAIAFIVVLIPIGYATYLLFRPARPAIESVTRVEVTREERRVAGGMPLTAKLKVRGSGFNPLLRARIGGFEAMGFVFENPNSADVLVGIVPPGRHDLILYDGIHEVARAREAVEVVNISAPRVRAFGWLTRLSPADAPNLKPGFASEAQAPNAFEIVTVGPAQPARARIGSEAQVADILLEGQVERAAEILVRCDFPSTESCRISGEDLTPLPMMASLPGGYYFQIEEVAPTTEPVRAIVRVQLDGPLPITVGDRDAVLGSRAAEVTGVAGSTVTLRLGADQSRDGWRYRGRLLAPGSRFEFSTDRYAAGGRIMSVTVETAADR